MSRLNEIKDFLKGKELNDIEIENILSQSVYLSMAICDYAHINQTRINGEPYSYHPRRCLEKYRNMLGITPDDYYCIDIDLIYKYNIPYEGVQEVCLLHDVLEDTDFTIDEIEEIFKESSLDTYFDLYIKRALINITHNDNDTYEEYINKCMKNSVSALAKIMDLVDNSNPLTLINFNHHNYKRTIDYIKYVYIINNEYHFIENVEAYKKEFNNN